jgi:hypothetical protein
MIWLYHAPCSHGPHNFMVGREMPAADANSSCDQPISVRAAYSCPIDTRPNLADAGYGQSAPFRQALTARKLAWAVGIPRG